MMALNDYDSLILGAAKQYNVDPQLLKSVMKVESNGNPNAVNAKSGASGLMQFLSGTASDYGVQPLNPQSAVYGGAHYLSDLLKQYGSPDAALDHYGGYKPGYGTQILDAYRTVPPPVMPDQNTQAATPSALAGSAPATPGPAGNQPGGGTVAPMPIIDVTKQAGFGTKFGKFADNGVPQGMIIHHTAGRGSVDSVINTYKSTNFPAPFIIDRDGNIYQALPDGYQGQH